MKLDEFKSITTKILSNLSDQASVSDLLMQLNDDYAQQLTNHDNLTNQIGEAQGQIKSLQQTNMNLFLKVANPVPDKVIQTPEKATYDDLINSWDKGAN